MKTTAIACALSALLLGSCGDDDAPPPTPAPMKPAASGASSVSDATLDGLSTDLAKALEAKTALLKKAGASATLSGADAVAFWDADAAFLKSYIAIHDVLRSNGRLTPRIVASLKKNAYNAMEQYAFAEKACGVARASGKGIAGQPPAGHPRLDPSIMNGFELKRMEIMTKFNFTIT